MSEQNCKNCKYWANWEDKFYAGVTGVTGGFFNGILELRGCAWKPHPSVNIWREKIYTDENYFCEEWKG